MVSRLFDASAADLTALTSTVTSHDVERFKASVRAAPWGFPDATRQRLRSFAHLLGDIFAWTIIAGPAVVLAVLVWSTGMIPLALITDAAAAAAIILITLFVVRDISLHARLRNPWARWLRLTRFAADNGLVYRPTSARSPLSGTIFAFSGRSTTTDRFISHKRQRFEIGNLFYAHGDGNSATTTWGYLAIGLNRKLPHIVLRATSNTRGRRGLPGKIAADQALSLEGDFNRYFTLYAPRAYERDALYVFAPDLMALMIDEALALEVEIVDDWIFFYSPKPFDLASRRTAERLMRIASVIGAKTFRQTDRYWDERTGAPFAANVVDAPGRRLRVRFAAGGILLILWVLSEFFRSLSNALGH